MTVCKYLALPLFNISIFYRLYLALLCFRLHCFLYKMSSAVPNSQTLLNAIEDTAKGDPMDRYSPSNMSTDENNASENLPELNAVNTTSKAESTRSRRSSKNSLSDCEGSNMSSKGSVISSNKEADVGKIDIKEKSTNNRILKRKKRKFDWEVIIVNEDLAKNENEEKESEEKETEDKENKYKLTVSNFPTHWNVNELKEFILELVCIF